MSQLSPIFQSTAICHCLPTPTVGKENDRPIARHITQSSALFANSPSVPNSWLQTQQNVRACRSWRPPHHKGRRAIACRYAACHSMDGYASTGQHSASNNLACALVSGLASHGIRETRSPVDLDPQLNSGLNFDHAGTSIMPHDAHYSNAARRDIRQLDHNSYDGRSGNYYVNSPIIGNYDAASSVTGFSRTMVR